MLRIAAAAWPAVMGFVLAVAVMPALAQEQNPQTSPEPPASEQPAQKDGRGGGLIEALGDFFDKAAEGLSLKGATDTITDLNRKAGEATRDAAKSATTISAGCRARVSRRDAACA